MSFEDAARANEESSMSSYSTQSMQASTSDYCKNIDPELLMNKGQEPSASVVPFKKSAAMHTYPSVASILQQPMQASFSMNDVNAQLESRNPKSAAGLSEHTQTANLTSPRGVPFTRTFGEHSYPTSRRDSVSRSYHVSRSMPYHQPNFEGYASQSSQPSPHSRTAPWWTPPSWEPKRTPSTVPSYATTAPQDNARTSYSAVPPSGSSAIRQIGQPNPANYYSPVPSHTSMPTPPTAYHAVASAPQPAYTGHGTQSLSMLPPELFSTAMAPPSSPMWSPMLPPPPGFVHASRNSVPSHRLQAWPQTTSYTPVSTAMRQNSFLASPYVQSVTASPISSNPWDNEGQLTNSGTGYCNLTSCKYRCSSDPCPSGCMPSCNGSEACSPVYGCTGSCRASQSTPVSQPLSRSLSISTRDVSLGDSMQCQWLLPDQQCDVSVSNKNALGQHVLQEHIQPQRALTCPWDQCAATLDQEQMPSHMMRQHRPDSYVCLFQDCGQSFSRPEDLDEHFQRAHSSLDCHWAGCDVITPGPAQLRHHINTDHLQTAQQGLTRAPSSESTKPGSRQSSPAVTFGRHTIGSSWDQLIDTDKMLVTMKVQGSSWAQINAAWKDATGSKPGSSTLPNRLRRIQARLATSTNGLGMSATSLASPAVTSHGQAIQLPVASAFAPSLPSPASAQQHRALLPRPAPFPQAFSPSNSRAFHAHGPPPSPSPTVLQNLGAQCLWILASSTTEICGEQFQNGNELQRHADRVHVHGLGPGLPTHTSSTVVCKWRGCKRKGERLQSAQKLSRHLYIHTGCM